MIMTSKQNSDKSALVNLANIPTKNVKIVCVYDFEFMEQRTLIVAGFGDFLCTVKSKVFIISE